MARTRWPPGSVKPRPLAQAGQIRPAPLVGARKPGPRPADRFAGQPERASADSQARPGPRLPTLRPRSVKIGEARPEALPTLSLPITSGFLPGRAHRVSAHRTSGSEPVSATSSGSVSRAVRPAVGFRQVRERGLLCVRNVGHRRRSGPLPAPDGAHGGFWVSRRGAGEGVRRAAPGILAGSTRFLAFTETGAERAARPRSGRFLPAGKGSRGGRR
jgi:hypothetical protein